jgi:hypothetical protein
MYFGVRAPASIAAAAEANTLPKLLMALSVLAPAAALARSLR